MIDNQLTRRGYLKVEGLEKWKTNKSPLSFANNLWLTLKQLECVMGRRAKDLEVSRGEWDKDPGARTAIGDIFGGMSEHVNGLCSWWCHCQWVWMGLVHQKHEEVLVPCGCVWMVVSWEKQLRGICYKRRRVRRKLNAAVGQLIPFT